MSLYRSIYSYLDYKAFVRNLVISNQSTYGYKAMLAEAAGCQRSFLSQVLNGKPHLMPEHAVGLAEFWKFSKDEKSYFMDLLSYARAATKQSRDYFLDRIHSARLEQENLVNRIGEKKVLDENTAAVFYSQWFYLGINILLTIPKFRTLQGISNRLKIETAIVEKALTQLEQLGLVIKSGSEWRPSNAIIHVPKESQFNSLNHSHWRSKAVENSYLNIPGSVHYTSVCSVSLEDAEKLKELTLALIDKSREVIAPSPEEELFCLTLDWFKV